MPPEADNPSSDSDNPLSLDLSSLSDLQFGPDWSDRKKSSIQTGSEREGRGDRGGPGNRDRRSGPPRKDRRSAKPPHGGQGAGGAGGSDFGQGRPPRREQTERGQRRGDDSQPPRREGGRGPRQGGDRRPPAPFRPVIEVLIYPDDLPFKALCHAMRTNCRTYELFEIARLILEKPERFVVVLKPSDKVPDGPKAFYIAVPDGLPFDSETAAINHVLQHHLDHFCDTEEIEVEPPKGNFPVIHKCGVTGKLIGPPNYHRYQSLLQEHYASNCAQMSFERFGAKIESVKDEAAATEWATAMSKQTRYKLKQPAEDAPEAFDSLESLKYYLTTKRHADMVKVAQQARIAGNRLEQLPRGDIRRSIEAELEHQRHFPLITSNNLRGRLRRLKFTIYKKGSKGVSFVCSVKRKFRDPNRQFADSIQNLLDFLDAHPETKVTELPEKFLGISPQAPAEAQEEKAPEIESVDQEQAAQIVEAHELKRQEAKAAKSTDAEAQGETPAEASPETATAETPAEQPAEAVAPETQADASEIEATEAAPPETPGDGADPAPAETAESDSGADESTAEVTSAEPPTEPAERKPQLLDVNETRIRALMNTLRWLVTEGYVIEFGDGRLLANPPLSPASEKDSESVAEPETAEPTDSPEQPEQAAEALTEQAAPAPPEPLETPEQDPAQ